MSSSNVIYMSSYSSWLCNNVYCRVHDVDRVEVSVWATDQLHQAVLFQFKPIDLIDS